MRSCARRSFDDETIFMAFVICCVDFTARTRRRMSISDGMVKRQLGLQPQCSSHDLRVRSLGPRLRWGSHVRAPAARDADELLVELLDRRRQRTS